MMTPFVLLLSLQLGKGFNCPDGTDVLTYAGNISITNFGRMCQSWSEQKPHRHRFNDDDDFEYDGSVKDARNFCRNPDSDASPWCYTVDPFTRWGYCDAQVCGETTQTCGGTIQISDEYHLNYTKWESFFFTTESNCLWTLQAPSDTLLSLTFVTVSLKCDAVSYIQVYEPGFNHVKICQNNTMSTQTSKSNMLYIQFKCFPCYEVGFYVIAEHVTPLDGSTVVDPSCGGYITEPNAIIQNRDRDGDSQYDVIDYCVWKIVAPEGYVIQIDFEMLEIEYDEYCSDDFLEVYDTNTVYTKLCGNSLPVEDLVSMSNDVSICFFSDFNVITGRGFRLNVSHVLNTNIPEGTLTARNNLSTVTTSGTTPQPDVASRDFHNTVMTGCLCVVSSVLAWSLL